MRVRFEYTIADLVDVQMRVLKRSRTARAWRWQDLIITSLVSGVLLFAIIPEGITGKLIVGTIGLVTGALFYVPLNDAIVRRRLRKFFAEQVGADKPLFCEVELKESGVHTSSNGTQLIFAWENVNEIKETQDSVDIQSERGGLVVVRKRAFSSTEEQFQFVGLANQYLKMAQEASQSDRASQGFVGS
jgi:hypothetical protein